MYITGAQHVLIERNVTKDSGTSAIEAYYADDVVIQYNETYGTMRKAGGADSNGIDADRATTNVIIQYNYVHDNGDGILLCQIAFGDVVVRYNFIVNSSRMGINLHSDKSATSQIYNNLFYGSAALTNSSGGSSFFNGNYPFTNNIFYASGGGATVARGGKLIYNNNLFHGVNPVGGNAVTDDPLFVSIGNWPNGDESGPALEALADVMIQAGSPAIDKGMAMSEMESMISLAMNSTTDRQISVLMSFKNIGETPLFVFLKNSSPPRRRGPMQATIVVAHS